jgi:hypothetical protein
LFIFADRELKAHQKSDEKINCWQKIPGTLPSLSILFSRLHVFVMLETPCASPRPSVFSDYSFLVHHPVTRDDRHHLAHAINGF